MITLIKTIITALLSLCLFSCQFDININSGIKGNGNIEIKNRDITKPFSSISASEGLDVYLTQSNNESITIETDENLHDIIITEVINNVLKIHTTENIQKCKSKKVKINFKNITDIKSSSGSKITSTNTIKLPHLNLKSTSGSYIKLDVITTTLNSKTTSGSEIRLTGKTEELTARSSSGSTIKAANLITQTSNIKASSGANITTNTLKELTANASSGGAINYIGSPDIINKNNSVSGSIKRQ